MEVIFKSVIVQTIISIGKIIAQARPALRLSEQAPETIPTMVGPLEHPISPARAKSANIAVPPFGSFDEAILNTPGHIIPTESPHKAHPISESSGIGERTVIK